MIQPALIQPSVTALGQKKIGTQKIKKNFFQDKF